MLHTVLPAHIQPYVFEVKMYKEVPQTATWLRERKVRDNVKNNMNANCVIMDMVTSKRETSKKRAHLLPQAYRISPRNKDGIMLLKVSQTV